MMGVLASYSLAASIYLLIGWVVYRLVLADHNQHALNRAILLTIYGLSLLMPAISFTRTEAATAPEFGHPLVMVEPGGAEATTDATIWPAVVAAVYLCGAAAVLLMTLCATVRLVSIVMRGRRSRLGKMTIVLSRNTKLAPFSWLRYIVVNDRLADNSDWIIIHESAHLQYLHWIDLLLAQIVCVLMWYNPAAWLMRVELRAVHEYQADARVVAEGIDVRQYQYMLIKKAVGQRFPSLANSLNHSKLKQRITMMYNHTSSLSRRLAALALAPAMLAAAAVINMPAVASVLDSTARAQFDTDKISENRADDQTSTPVVDAQDQTDSDVENAPDCLPQFPGGEVEMFRFLMDNMHYPENAVKNNIEGKVLVGFKVDTDGKISDITIRQSVDEELDAEAARVVAAMPKWKPAMKDGKAVACRFVLPVSFKLVKDRNRPTRM